MGFERQEISDGWQVINDWYLATPEKNREALEHRDRLETRLSLRWNGEHWWEDHIATIRGEQRQLRFETLPQSGRIWPFRDESSRRVRVTTREDAHLDDWELATKEKPLEARVLFIDNIPPRQDLF